MKMPTSEMIEAYLDGDLPAEQRSELEQLLAADPAAQARLEHTRTQRQLRQLAWRLELPTDEDAKSAAAACLAEMHTSAADGQIRLIRFLRISAAAAVLVLTAAGGFMVGRARPLAPVQTVRPIVGYTVKITMNDGSRVAQTFTTFKKAEDFVNAYRLEQKATPAIATPRVQVASEGIF